MDPTRLLIVCALAVGANRPAGAEAQALTPAAERDWLRHVLPLPHEVTLSPAVSVPRATVTITAADQAGPVQQAVADLRALLGPATGDGFELALRLPDAEGKLPGIAPGDLDRLRGLPNRQQAYLLRGTDRRLTLAALDPRGLFHGSRTLRQLLAARLTDQTVTIPLGPVTDWPDLEERGLWNFPLDLIPWLADRKLNFAKVPTTLNPIKRDQPVTLRPVADGFLDGARRRGFNPVLTSTHLNFLHRHGLNEAYPELVGKGERAKCPYKYQVDGATAPCASQPQLRRIIADWLREAGRQGGEEVSIWLTEFYAQCECPECLKAGQFQLETKATLAAFEEVQPEYPRLRLRIFFTLRRTPVELQASRECLAMLPAGVKAEIVYGTTAPYVEAAGKGVWVGDYGAPYLTKGGSVGLSTYPSWVRGFLRQTAERGFRSAYAISYLYTGAAWHEAVFSQQIEALAEWSWNLNGRDLREFAAAWATRQGMDRPEQVADCVVALDPLAADLVQSTHGLFADGYWPPVYEALAAGRLPKCDDTLFWPMRGEGGWERVAERAGEALRLAGQTGERTLELEAAYLVALVDALRLVRELAARRAAGQDPSPVLADLAAAIERLNTALDARLDLFRREPAEFAEQSKRDHRQRWQQRLEKLRQAVG